MPVFVLLFGFLPFPDDPFASTNQSWSDALQPFAISCIAIVQSKSVKHRSGAIHPIRKLSLFASIDPGELTVQRRIRIFFPATLLESDGATEGSGFAFEISVRRESALYSQEI